MFSNKIKITLIVLVALIGAVLASGMLNANLGKSSLTPKIERTLSIIKPDAVAKHVIGKIYTKFEDAGLAIVAAKMVSLTKEQAENFYAEHKSKEFFVNLIKFMTSGPVMIQVLEGKDAIVLQRKLIGGADKPGTIRAEFGTSETVNAVHGSDTSFSAEREVRFFFDELELK